MQLAFESVPVDSHARMDVDALRKRLERGDVGTVVATMGTTATGSVVFMDGGVRQNTPIRLSLPLAGSVEDGVV